MADTAHCAQTESLLRGCSPACERPESRGELRLSSEQCIHYWWAVSRCFWARAPPKLLKARRASLVGAPKQPPPRGWRVTRVGVVPALEGKVSLESDRDRGLENQPEIGSDTHDRPRTSDIRRKCWFLTGLQVWMMFWWIYIWKYERRAVTWAWWYHGWCPMSDSQGSLRVCPVKRGAVAFHSLLTTSPTTTFYCQCLEWLCQITKCCSLLGWYYICEIIPPHIDLSNDMVLW